MIFVTSVFKIGVAGVLARFALAKSHLQAGIVVAVEGAVLQYAEAAFHLHSVVASVGEGQSSVVPIVGANVMVDSAVGGIVGHCAEVKYRCLARVGEQTDAGILAA